MLKRLVNECRFTLQLETMSPFLVKDGRYNKEKLTKPKSKDEKSGYPDAVFISTNLPTELATAAHRNDFSCLNFYLPGTSLRGVIRSHAERIVRTRTEDNSEPICCDPFEEKDAKRMSCSHRLEETLAKLKGAKKSSEAYRCACVICKLFGSTNNRSRIFVSDGKVTTKGKVNLRDSIGIDRFTGGVSANFKNLVLENYTFQSEILIRNFELWQLGLLAYVIQDFKDEHLTIGFGKAKDFGRVKGKIVGPIQVTYFGKKQDTRLTDLGDRLGDDNGYRFVAGSLNDTSLLEKASSASMLSYRETFEVKDEVKFWEAVAGVWNQALEDGKFDSVEKLIPTPDSENGTSTEKSDG